MERTQVTEQTTTFLPAEMTVGSHDLLIPSSGNGDIHYPHTMVTSLSRWAGKDGHIPLNIYLSL